MSNTQTNIEIADIFREHAHKLVKLSNSQENVINRIVSCRTAALGGHLLDCDSNNCDYYEISYNSCQDRHCPKCQSLAKEKWIFNREQELLPVPYFHVVFTIPRILAPIALQNKEIVYTLLFKAVSKTIKQVIGSKEQLDASAGCITVLHTWDQKLLHHPHIHCIVPGGGVAKDRSAWISSNPNFLVSTKILSSVFRGKFLSGLEKLYNTKLLKFYNSYDYLYNSGSFKDLLIESCKNDWVVDARRPFKNIKSVINYLGRYTHRVAISNYRILSVKNNIVSFTYQDRKDNNKQKTLHLPVIDFMKRFLLHILPRGFVRIRYYGFLSSAVKKEMLELCRTFLEFPASEEKTTNPENWIELIMRVSGKDPTICPRCGCGHLQKQHGIYKDSNPPDRKLN